MLSLQEVYSLMSWLSERLRLLVEMWAWSVPTLVYPTTTLELGLYSPPLAITIWRLQVSLYINSTAENFTAAIILECLQVDKLLTYIRFH